MNQQEAISGMRAFSRAMIESSMFIDPVNKPRALYLAGFIGLEEFEQRVADALGLT